MPEDTDGYQLDPEQPTAPILIQHPDMKSFALFRTGGSPDAVQEPAAAAGDEFCVPGCQIHLFGRWPCGSLWAVQDGHTAKFYIHEACGRIHHWSYQRHCMRLCDGSRAQPLSG